MERSRRGNLRDFNINNFPRSFYFFKNILSVPAGFQAFSIILVFVGYFQEASLTFLPYIYEHVKMDDMSYIRQFFSILLFFHPNPYHLSDVDTVLSILSIFIFVILVTIIAIFLCDNSGLPIPRILMRSRGLLFMFAPTLYTTVICTHLGLYIYRYGNENLEIYKSFSFYMIVVIDILEILFLTIWSFPLIKKSPILSNSHIPATLIHNANMTIIHFFVMFFVTIDCISEHHCMSYFYTTAIAIAGTVRLILLIKQPLISKADSAITAAISLSWIVIGIINEVCRQTKIMNEAAMTSVCIAFHALSFFIFWTYFSYQEKSILSNIMTNSIHFTDTDYALKTVQIAVVRNKITDHLISQLSELNHVNGSPESITAEVYIRLLHGTKNDLNLIDTIMTPLVYSKSSLWTFRYTIFELACQFTRDYYSNDSKPPLENVEWYISHYKNSYDRFWSETLSGDIGGARKVMLELRRYYTKAKHEFRIVRAFYPKHPHVLKIFKEFFMALEPPGSFIEPLCDLHARLDSFLNNRIQKKVDEYELGSIHKLSLSRVSNWILFGFLMATLVSAVILASMATPGFVPMNFTGPIEKMPNFIGATQRMVMTWLNISAGVIHLNNGTVFTNPRCSEVVPGELVAHCFTVPHIINEFENSSYSLIDDLMTINAIYDEFIQYEEFALAQKIWLVRNIIMYSAEFLGTINISEIVQNIRAIFVNFAGMIIAKKADISSDYSRILWPDTYVFYNITDQVMQSLRYTYKYYFDFIERVRKEKLVMSSPTIIAITIIFSIVYIGILYSMGVLKSYFFHSQILKYFITGKHPLHLDEEWQQFEPKPFQRLSGAWILMGFGVLFVAAAVVMNIAFNINIHKEYKEAINKIDAILNTADAGHVLGFIRHYTHREWLFQEMPEKEYFVYWFNQLQSLIINLSSKLNPSFLQMEEIPEALAYPNITELLKKNVTAHAIFNSFNIFQSINQISYGMYSSEKSNYSEEKLYAVLHSQEHIFLEHISPKMISLVSYLKGTVVNSTDQVYFLGIQSLCANVLLFVIQVVIFVLLVMYLNSVHFQFNRIILGLDQSFIASHSCLMEYFTNTGDDYTGIPSPTFKFYGKGGLNLILTDSSGTIICATSGVRNLFSQPSVQLIGQNLDVLIPNRTQNSSGLWAPLSMMKKGRLEPFLEKDVVGVTGEGIDISVHVGIAMLKTSDNSAFFMLEFSSNNEANFLEDQFSEVYEYSSDLISSCLPVSLFNGLHDVYMKQHYDSGILLIVGFQEVHSRDFLEFKTQFIADIAQLRGGYGNGLMVKMTPSQAVIVFADVLKNNSHYSNALEVLKVFRQESFVPYGVAISVNPFDAIVFREPQFESENNDVPFITSTEAEKYAATMLIEPQIPELDYYGDLLNFIKEGSVIVTKDVAQIAGAPCEGAIKGFPIELHYIDINAIV